MTRRRRKMTVPPQAVTINPNTGEPTKRIKQVLQSRDGTYTTPLQTEKPRPLYVSQKPGTMLFVIQREQGGHVPLPLQGSYTSKLMADKALKGYLDA